MVAMLSKDATLDPSTEVNSKTSFVPVITSSTFPAISKFPV